MNKHYIVITTIWTAVLFIAFVAKAKVFIQLLPLFGIATFLYLLYCTISTFSISNNNEKTTAEQNKQTNKIEPNK